MAKESGEIHPQYRWYDLIDPILFQQAVSHHTLHILEQGDILEGYEILTRVPVDPGQIGTAQNAPVFHPTKHDLIVLSQSCDLAQLKTDFVITCELFEQRDYREEGDPVAKPDGLKRLRKGDFVALYLLNKCTEVAIPGYERPFRIVDFPHIHALPVDDVLNFLTKEPHLRLLPPYREHLSQAFARFFMRVGLPQDIALPEDSKQAVKSCQLCERFKLFSK